VTAYVNGQLNLSFEVFVNGKSHGNESQLTLPRGQHKVSVKVPGYRLSKRKTADLSAGDNRVRFDLNDSHKE
jgi:hypothetical protein